MSVNDYPIAGSVYSSEQPPIIDAYTKKCEEECKTAHCKHFKCNENNIARIITSKNSFKTFYCIKCRVKICNDHASRMQDHFEQLRKKGDENSLMRNNVQYGNAWEFIHVMTKTKFLVEEGKDPLEEWKSWKSKNNIKQY